MRGYLELGWGLSGYVILAVYLFGLLVILLTLFYKVEIGLFYATILT